MKVLAFKRKETELTSLDKSLNLTDVCHQKLDQLEEILASSKNSQNLPDCAIELKRINSSLDLVLKRLSTKEEYKKVV